MLRFDLAGLPPTCEICRCGILDSNHLVTSACSHSFHRHCIAPWANMIKDDKSCPLCQSRTSASTPTLSALFQPCAATTKPDSTNNLTNNAWDKVLVAPSPADVLSDTVSRISESSEGAQSANGDMMLEFEDDGIVLADALQACHKRKSPSSKPPMPQISPSSSIDMHEEFPASTSPPQNPYLTRPMPQDTTFQDRTSGLNGDMKLDITPVSTLSFEDDTVQKDDFFIDDLFSKDFEDVTTEKNTNASSPSWDPSVWEGNFELDLSPSGLPALPLSFNRDGSISDIASAA